MISLRLHVSVLLLLLLLPFSLSLLPLRTLSLLVNLFRSGGTRERASAHGVTRDFFRGSFLRGLEDLVGGNYND